MGAAGLPLTLTLSPEAGRGDEIASVRNGFGEYWAICIRCKACALGQSDRMEPGGEHNGIPSPRARGEG